MGRADNGAMFSSRVQAAALCALSLSWLASATEMTYELVAHEKACFYEEMDEGVQGTLEFQVVYGGHLDIDVIITDTVNELWSMRKAQTGSHSFRADRAGTYELCFSNEMSTMAHKTVYFDFIAGSDDPLLDKAHKDHQTFTQLETSLLNSHDALRRIIDLQTYLRMREATHRYTAEYMNERVQVVSGAEALVLITLSIFQIWYLKSLFNEKPDRW